MTGLLPAGMSVNLFFPNTIAFVNLILLVLYQNAKLMSSPNLKKANVGVMQLLIRLLKKSPNL